MLAYSIISTIIMIINFITLAIYTYRIDKIKQTSKGKSETISMLVHDIRLLNKTMERMADDLTTDYHSKEWVIQHYMSEVRNGKN